MVLYIQRDRLAANDQAASEAKTTALTADIERQKTEAEQAAQQPSYALPSLQTLVGAGQSPVMQAIGALPQMGRQAEQKAHGALSWALPDLSTLGVTPEPPPAPSGTPAAMPTAPGLTPATITTGPRPGQTLQPGESVGSVTLAGGSHPEKQAEVYRQAIANGLDDEGARILVAITETEGGLTGAVGDTHLNARGSRGPFQFYEGGQMPGFRGWLQQQGIQGDPDVLVNDVGLATRYAATGYLGRAIAAGRQQGLSGAELATYVQRHGQVSEHPERTGANYQRLYGPGAQTYPDRGQPAVRENVPTAPPTPPQASDARTYPEQTVRPMPAPATGPKLRVMDKWGNEFEMTQDDLNKRPGGYADLTILGPVAMSNAGAAPPPAAMAPAGPGGPPPSTGAGALHPTVAQAFRSANGREPTPEEASELAQAFGMMA